MSMARAAQHGLLRNALFCILPAALILGVLAQLWALLFALGAAYLLKVVLVFTAGAGLVLLGLSLHHPFKSFGAANQVIVIRGALVALLAGLIAERSDTGAPALAVVMATTVAILDGLDGWLARRTRMVSPFGARFDMETDAILIMVLAVLAVQFGKAGAWVLASGLLRYAFVAASLVLPWLRNPLPPSERRKAVAVLQMIVLIVTLAPFVPVAIATPLAAAGLGVLMMSFAVDVLWLFQNTAQPRAGASPQ